MKILNRAIMVIVLGLIFPGCIRLTGGAGYWHEDAQGEVKSKQVGFDTQNLVDPNHAPGDITV